MPPEDSDEVILKRKSHYRYLECQVDVEWQKKAYKSVVNWLTNGVRVKDFECDSLRNIQAFGAQNAFFEEDRLLLIDFSEAIITV